MSSASCRYQEGGKRGIPIQYMTSLESRLDDTESALYAALCALHTREGDNSVPELLYSDIMGPSTLPRSKAEKQSEWKQRPLRTSQDILAWYEQQHQSTSTRRDEERPNHVPSSHFFPGPPVQVTAAALQDERDQSKSAQSDKIPEIFLETLKKCQPPCVPNSPTSHTVTWFENYF